VPLRGSHGSYVSNVSSSRLVDDWTVLGDPILAYRLHVIKSGWSLIGEGSLTAKSFNPGDAGFMNVEEEMDDFEGAIGAVLRDDIDRFADEQYFQPDYLGVEDDEEEWVLATLIELNE
jgi:hypothetical protein